MTAQILDGKETARLLREELRVEVEQWCAGGGPQPTLAAVLVGDDPASQVYVRNKERACGQVGMASRLIRRPDSTSTTELLDLLSQLNQDGQVNGILVQLPLPRGIETQRVLDAVASDKDVDAFCPENVGLLVQGRPRFLPCTPHGVVNLLVRYKIELAGKHVVVVGRSEIVGKPLANMLVQRDIGYGPKFANATVTICHSQSSDLAGITRQADVLVAAVGRPSLITAEMVKPEAV
ncbi:MAG: tetrahydrofolate dehydrogenase/cyclohydrolase catalytic domain-containing protein, partial [Aureliella sp.]